MLEKISDGKEVKGWWNVRIEILTAGTSKFLSSGFDTVMSG